MDYYRLQWDTAGLQWHMKGYNRLQWDTTGYRVLWWVSRDCGGLHQVMEGLQQVTEGLQQVMEGITTGYGGLQ